MYVGKIFFTRRDRLFQFMGGHLTWYAMVRSCALVMLSNKQGIDSIITARIRNGWN